MASVLIVIILVTFLGRSLAAEEDFVLPSQFKPITKLADDIPTCRQKDRNINKCIRQGFQKLTPRLKYGISDLNIPPMDPFQLGKCSYNFSSIIMHCRIAMRNVLVHGLSEGIVDKVDYRQKNNRVRMEMLSHVPELLAEGAYKADFKLNDMKLTPEGTFNITLTDVSMKTRALGELYERDGHTYLRLTKLETEPKVGYMRLYANGMLPFPSMNDVLLNFINHNWQKPFRAILPETRPIWEPILLQVSNDFFAALPFDLIVTKD